MLNRLLKSIVRMLGAHQPQKGLIGHKQNLIWQKYFINM